MRRVLESTSNGEIWMEETAGIILYHVAEKGGVETTTSNPKLAKREWQKIKDKSRDFLESRI